ncbi:MAG: hypothetical protein IAE89_04675 [Anaerolineae bacterium]|nr:hypothetical protein [Anaerolineae bacterium]
MSNIQTGKSYPPITHLPPHFWLILLLIAAAALVARMLPNPRTIDDAFITFRYSRNLLDGLGFVYNPGVHTLGTTTPLWTLIMAFTGGLLNGRDFPAYALALSAVADAITCILIFLLARRLTRSDYFAAFPAFLWAVAPMSVTFAIGGMETSLNILWMFAAFSLYILVPTTESSRRKRWREASIGACVALGFLTRADAVLWIAPLLGWQFLEGLRARRLPLITWLAVGVILLPWVIFSIAQFGSPIPNSVTAKRNAYLIQPLSAFTGLLRTYSNLFFAFDTFGSIGTMISSIVILVYTLFAFPYAARKLPRALPLFIYPWLYFAIFSALNPLMFRWYFAPPLPALMLAVFTGFWALLAPLQTTRAKAIIPLAAGAFGVLCLITSLNAWTLHPTHGANRPAPQMAWHEIELLYRQMGEYLRDDLGVTAATRIASADIGAIGFFSSAIIVDTVGLVTPELRDYYPVDLALIVEGQNYAIPPQLIHDTRPDFLVTMEAFIRYGLAQQAEFLEQYTLIREIPTGFYGDSMQLWQRNS